MRYPRIICGVIFGILLVASLAPAQPLLGGKDQDDKKKMPKTEEIKFPAIPTILDKESRPIDLASALQLAGV